MSRLTVVGCGPGGTSLITSEAKIAIENSRVVMGTKRLVESFVSKNISTIATSAYSSEAIGQISNELGHGDVTLLVTGNSTLYGLGNHLGILGEAHSISFLPGISSTDFAYARLGINSSNSTVVSVHGQDPKLTADQLLMFETFAVLCGVDEGKDYIFHLFNKLKCEYRIYYLKDLSLKDELVIEVDETNIESLSLKGRVLFVFTKSERIL